MRLCHSYDLPADVFGPGESKPVRPKKKTVVRKRSLESEVCPSPACYMRIPGRYHPVRDELTAAFSIADHSHSPFYRAHLSRLMESKDPKLRKLRTLLESRYFPPSLLHIWTKPRALYVASTSHRGYHSSSLRTVSRVSAVYRGYCLNLLTTDTQGDRTATR